VAHLQCLQRAGTQEPREPGPGKWPHLRARVGKKLRVISTSKTLFRGIWVAQLFECPNLYFGSGHDFRVVRSSPPSGSMLALSLSLK